MNGVQVYFTSSRADRSPKSAVLDLINMACELSRDTHGIDLHIVQFSVTNKEIVDLLIKAALHSNIRSIKIIADWCQGGPGSGRLIPSLEQLNLPNLLIRYKKDQPYIYDLATGSLKWSYKSSRGLLHHKLMILNVEGRPVMAAFGSYNWTARADKASYENLVILHDSLDATKDVINRFEDEFRCLWASPEATLSGPEAVTLYSHILDQYALSPRRHPSTIQTKGIGAGIDKIMAFEGYISTNCDPSSACRVAFSYRGCDSGACRNGISDMNSSQSFLITKPAGRQKRIPLSLSALSLQVIHRAVHGDCLKIAMFAFSRRVSEYSAIIDAARRGVIILILTDKRTSRSLLQELDSIRSLPIKVRTGQMYMHQKYIIHPNSGTVAVGTANFTIDSSRRHSENRVIFDGQYAVAKRFEQDFDRIWDRLSQDRIEI